MRHVLQQIEAQGAALKAKQLEQGQNHRRHTGAVSRVFQKRC